MADFALLGVDAGQAQHAASACRWAQDITEEGDYELWPEHQDAWEVFLDYEEPVARGGRHGRRVGSGAGIGLGGKQSAGGACRASGGARCANRCGCWRTRRWSTSIGGINQCGAARGTVQPPTRQSASTAQGQAAPNSISTPASTNGTTAAVASSESR